MVAENSLQIPILGWFKRMNCYGVDHFDWRKSQVTLARNLNYLAANLKTASIFKGWRLRVFTKTDVL